MYRIPDDLGLCSVAGHCTTRIRVGQFDVQFSIWPVDFAVQSPLTLFRDGQLPANWVEGRWPGPGFYDMMNTEVRGCEVVNDRLIEFESGIGMHLEDSSDQCECMQISFEGERSQWKI